MQAALDELDARAISWEFEVRSAHRTPDAVAEYARAAAGRGLKVLICGAGLAAALPGVVAAYSELPVIGVPLRSSMSVLDGLDALLSIVQMPSSRRRSSESTPSTRPFMRAQQAKQRSPRSSPAGSRTPASMSPSSSRRRAGRPSSVLPVEPAADGRCS
jgi:hypothetical protein